MTTTNTNATDNHTDEAINAVYVPFTNLKKHPNHPRRDSGDTSTLKSSMDREGQKIPIYGVQDDDEIIWIYDGWRRVEVGRELGWEKALIIITENNTPGNIAHQSYVINNEREDLNLIDKAHHLNTMKNVLNFSLSTLENKGYGSESDISKVIGLLRLTGSVQNHLAKGELNQRQGEEIGRLETETEQIKVAEKAIRNKWTVRRTKIEVDRTIAETENAQNEMNNSHTEPVQTIPGVHFKNPRDMDEIEIESVNLVFTTAPTFNEMKQKDPHCGIGNYTDYLKGVSIEASKKIVRGGVLAIVINNINNFKGKMDNTTHMRMIEHLFPSDLKREECFLEGKITLYKGHSAVIPEDDDNHTTQKIIDEHQSILIFRKKGFRNNKPSDEVLASSKLDKAERERYFSSVWDFSSEPKEVIKEKVARRIIRMYSYVGDTILDPFLDDGTSIKVAQVLKRKGIGYEKDTTKLDTIKSNLEPNEDVEETAPEANDLGAA